MSRNYNVLVVNDNHDLSDFLDSINYLLKKLNNATVDYVKWDWANYDSDSSRKHTYIITDYTQSINPEKLMDAFEDYNLLDEAGHYDEDDDWVIDKEQEEVQEEFLVKLVKKIWNSELYY